MKTMNTLFLVGLLALWMHLPSSTALPPIDKMGTCPPNPYRCFAPGQNACNFDYDCPGIQKCCYFKCDKICRNPQDKPGKCPKFPFICSVPGRDDCNHDYDCPENQKCCYKICGKSCIVP
ncbi:notewaprin-a [Pogona vitticeps]